MEGQKVGKEKDRERERRIPFKEHRMSICGAIELCSVIPSRKRVPCVVASILVESF